MFKALSNFLKDIQSKPRHNRTVQEVKVVSFEEAAAAFDEDAPSSDDIEQLLTDLDSERIFQNTIQTELPRDMMDAISSVFEYCRQVDCDFPIDGTAPILRIEVAPPTAYEQAIMVSITLDYFILLYYLSQARKI